VNSFLSEFYITFFFSHAIFKILIKLRVIKTKNGQYPLGTLVLANSGWQSHFIYSTDTKSDMVVVEHGNLTSIRVEPIRFDLGATHISHLLGILGMPG